VEVSQEEHTLESGQTLFTHTQGTCYGPYCAIHNPMPGPWAEWPRLWREDRNILERVCPHGVGHPVAEMYEWAITNGHGYSLVHGCCGECVCSSRVAKRPTERPADTIGVPDYEELPSSQPQELPFDEQYRQDITVMIDAINLLIQLWPTTSTEDSVTMTTEQWLKLRHVLAVVSDLVDRVYR
jgi:hypothetical protein